MNICPTKNITINNWRKIYESFNNNIMYMFYFYNGKNIYSTDKMDI